MPEFASQPLFDATQLSTLSTYAKSLLDIDLSVEQAEQFDRLTELLLLWNKRMNLTAITDPHEIATKHCLDALTLSLVINQFDGKRMIDVGTGAGFPGLALAIVLSASACHTHGFDR